MTNKGGRPSKATPQVIAQIAACLANGLNDREASLVVDIEPHTLVRWKKNPEFCAQIEKAVFTRMKKRVDKIENGGQGWQGTAWVLERLYKDRFMRPEIALAQQINITTGELTLKPDQLLSLSEAYNKEKQLPANVETPTASKVPNAR
jgi:hypothetical protein